MWSSQVQHNKMKNFFYMLPKRKAKEAVLALTSIMGITLVFSYVITSIRGIYQNILIVKSTMHTPFWNDIFPFSHMFFAYCKKVVFLNFITNWEHVKCVCFFLEISNLRFDEFFQIELISNIIILRSEFRGKLCWDLI